MLKQFNKNGVNVYIYEQEQNEIIKLLQTKDGQKNTLENIKNDNNYNVKCIINCSYFASDYPLGRNQGNYRDERPNKDNIIDVVIDENNNVICDDLESWDNIGNNCGFSVATVLIKNFQEVKEISFPIVSSYKLYSHESKQTLIAKADNKLLLIVSNSGLNAYDIKELILDKYNRVEFLAQLDGGGSTELITEDFKATNTSREMFNGLALVEREKNETKEERKTETKNNNGVVDFDINAINEPYTVRFAHLESIDVKQRQKVRYNDKIGLMGNTGYSYGTHLHLDVIKGVVSHCWKLHQMGNGDYIPVRSEVEFFSQGSDLFSLDNSRKTEISNGWLGYKDHYAHDLIASGNGIPFIYWNRSYTGTVIKTGYDNGYGNYVLVAYGSQLTKDEKEKEHNNTNEEKSEEMVLIMNELEQIKNENDKLKKELENYKKRLENIKNILKENSNND